MRKRCEVRAICQTHPTPFKKQKYGGFSQCTRVVLRSNNNANANGGIVYANANNDSSNANTNNGSRLANIINGKKKRLTLSVDTQCVCFEIFAYYNEDVSSR